MHETLCVHSPAGTAHLAAPTYKQAGVDIHEAASLVARNVNDVLTTGANPILFLDYVGMTECLI